MAFLLHDARALERRPRPPAPERAGAKRRLWRVDLLHAAAVASVAAVIALFLADGGANGFGDLGASLTSIGIIAGLVATDLVLIMLLLAARVPLIERAVGHDAAMALHGRLGKPVMLLLVGHGALLLAGYAITDGIGVMAEAVAIWSLPDLPLAVVAFGLFALVVVSSLVAVRRRLRYEAWHLIHLLVYIAVLASLPHQFEVGGLFAEGNWQRGYWLAAAVVALGSVVVFRVLVPLIVSWRHRLVVASVERLDDDTVSITMRGAHLERLGATGGQFFVWRFLARGQWWQAHPYSLSAAPTDDSLRITVRALGGGSAGLAGIRPGTRVAIEGPYGIFSEASRSRPRIAFVAAGIGVTPVRSLLETARFRPGEATVVLRTPTATSGWHLDEIAQLCRARGATLITVPGSRGSGWLTHDAESEGLSLRALVPRLADTDLYICGPRAWAEDVITEARAAGVAAEQIHHERFDW